jgi:hypothetical protein
MPAGAARPRERMTVFGWVRSIVRIDGRNQCGEHHFDGGRMPFALMYELIKP